MTITDPKQKTMPLVSSSRKLTAIGLFAALALVINASHITVPAPFAPFLFYDIWEIPIVIALIMFGLEAAVTVSLINLVGLILIQPGALASGPFYNLAATLIMLGGIMLGHRISNRISVSKAVLVSVVTAFGITTRTVGMVIFNGFLLSIPVPVGFGMTSQAVLVVLPLIAFFNATVALYTIPISYWIVKAIIPRYQFRLALPFSEKKAIR